MAAYDLIRLPNLLGSPYDQQKVTQNGINIGQIRHHEEPQPIYNARSPRAVGKNFSDLLGLGATADC